MITGGFKTLFQNKKFVFLWLSQIFSQLTIQIMNFLLIVRLFERTGSTIATSFIWIASALPSILIGPFAAVWVDFLDKRKVLVISNLLQFLVLLAYALTFKQYFFLSYVVVLAYSLFNQFYVPAEASSVPLLVTSKNLPEANGLFFLTQQSAVIVGFGIAGILSQIIGFEFTFLFLSVLLFLAFVSASFLPTIQVKVGSGKKLVVDIRDFFTRITEGYQFIRSNPTIFLPFALLASLQIVVSIISINLPIMAKEIVRINPNLSGTVIILPAGIGAFAAILFIPKYLRRMRKKELIEKSLIIIALSFWLITFLVPNTIQGLRVFYVSLLFFFIGISFVGIVIPAQTYLQEKTPKKLLGRVSGNFWFITSVATIFPVLFSATVSEVFGVRTLFFIIGLIAVAVYKYSAERGQRVLEGGGLVSDKI